MMKKILIFFIFVFSFQFSVEASDGRYIIPSNEDVLVEIGNPSHPASINPFDINVLVWNIYKGHNQQWKNEFENFIQNKDLVITQEAFLTDKVSNTLEQSGLHFSMAVSFKDGKYNQAATGVATGSRILPLEKKWQRSYYLEPVIDTPKMTLFTKYPLKGISKKLLVGNIHGINFVRAYKLRHMLEQAASIMKKHDGPAIFAGDFNTWTKTKLNNMHKVFKKLGYRYVKFRADHRTTFMGKVLDHVWIKNLKVISSSTPKVEGSDHTPMLVRLSISE